MIKKIIRIPGLNKVIGGDDVFVIAEIGKNFINTAEEKSTEVYLKNAIELVDAAVDAGVDAVKFQTHEVEDEILNIKFSSPHFKDNDRYSWVKRNTEATPLETFWKPLKAHCDSKNIIFFSTPMSRLAAKKLDKLDIRLWKVGSGDVQDSVLLNYISENKNPVIISTGMVSLEELDEVVDYLKKRTVPTIILYCVSKYPCKSKEFNLGTIEYLSEKYPHVVVGFSDHSIDDTDVDLAAIKLGARVIEKHFSFDREYWGSDHKVSITPDEMKRMIKSIRDNKYKNVESDSYYGHKTRELEGAKNIFRPYFNKSLMAGKNLNVGDIIEVDDVYAMRPVMQAGGLPSMRLESIIGKRLSKAVKKFDPITDELFK